MPIARRQRAPDDVPAPKDAPVLTFAQVAEGVTVGSGALLAEARNVYCQWTGPNGGPEPAPLGVKRHAYRTTPRQQHGPRRSRTSLISISLHKRRPP